MSTLSPSTPSSLTVPPSQNTAPVIKFRCLYTYDLRRKAKRWHDGFLRFHTFNRRVMVYDPPGNFIGDLHWRQDEGIQDGDEFELDKGVMVQVFECMEKTETDLSKLFENKKPAHGSPKLTQSATQSHHLSSPQLSPARPQPSLNALLGIKRTPIGRLVSPFEARHSLAQRDQQNDSGRGSKRQKIHLEEKHPETRRQLTNRPPSVIDLSESSTPPLKVTSTTRQPSQSLSRSERGPASKLSVSHTRPTPPPKHQPGQPGKRPKSPSDGQSASHVHNNPQPEVPATTLRLSTEKPRKKLMYQALLPPKAQAKPLEPVQLGKRSNPIVLPGSQSQLVCIEEHLGIAADDFRKVETVAPSLPVTSNEFMPSASTQLALDEIVAAKPTNGPTTKQDTLSLSFGQRPAARVSEGADTSASIPLLDPKPPPKQQALSKPSPPTFNQTQVSGLVPRRMSPQKGLRKSLSDPSALTMATGIRPRPLLGRSALSTLDEEKVDDQGPWTSEALDLFDFWPPGRPKPS